MTSSPITRTRAAGLLVAVLVSGLVGMVAPVSVSAHTSLVSMSPPDGSLVTVAPTSVVLTFDQNIQDVGDGVVVRDPTGANVEEGKPVVLNNTVTEKLKPITLPGRYTVDYRVTSADGHPVSKQLTFDYLERGSTPPTAADASSDSGSGVVIGVMVAVAALIVIALIAWLLVGRRSTTKGSST